MKLFSKYSKLTYMITYCSITVLCVASRGKNVIINA